MTEEGWKLEAEDKGNELYQQSEERLKQANALSADLNKELQSVNQAIQAALPPQQQVSSP
jgi:hypothetical protein